MWVLDCGLRVTGGPHGLHSPQVSAMQPTNICALLRQFVRSDAARICITVEVGELIWLFMVPEMVQNVRQVVLEIG